MSMSIAYCLISKAAKGDEKARKDLLNAVIYNLRYGHWSQFPCTCVPQCPEATAEEIAVLNKWLQEELEKNKDVGCR